MTILNNNSYNKLHGYVPDGICYKIIKDVVCVLVGSGFSNKTNTLSFRFMPVNKLNDNHKEHSVYEFIKIKPKEDRSSIHIDFIKTLLNEDAIKMKLL